MEPPRAKHVERDDAHYHRRQRGEAAWSPGLGRSDAQQYAVQRVTRHPRPDAGRRVVVREDIHAGHDLAHAHGAEDAGVLTVADAHQVLELAWGRDLSQSDADAGPAESAGEFLVVHD